MSLDKIRVWMTGPHGRTDISANRSPRQLEVLDKVCRIAMNLDGTVPQQGAKAGKGGEQHDLNFGRKMENRKTPVLYCGVLLKSADGQWFRRADLGNDDSVRVYLHLTPAGAKRSAWAERIHVDDGLKSDEAWRYIEIPPSLDISGEELLNLIEDAYFETSGI